MLQLNWTSVKTNIQLKKVVLGILFACIVAGVVAYKMYNKPHRDIGSEEAVATLSADELFAAFDEDEAAANAIYLDRVVEVSGVVDEVTKDAEGNTVVILKAETAMMGGVSATLDSSIDKTGTIAGDLFRVKGRCTGMLMDVVLTNCFPTE